MAGMTNHAYDDQDLATSTNNDNNNATRLDLTLLNRLSSPSSKCSLSPDRTRKITLSSLLTQYLLVTSTLIALLGAISIVKSQPLTVEEKAMYEEKSKALVKKPFPNGQPAIKPAQ
ncbi:hypothetical protein COCMIDRAFT_22445 [Bipolaris oryzae ATCC 44560]|uniref:Uncharacterized protein n=1 Tax=Bipolaris oryzae ATCC 44560 TaxID=930090 RepID=W6ZDI5_COCMI|nr:uncharacterized protein COCMIDRAFT_22445 [Bipolaris oryzae ATCC 44560]EUC49882.1 hypothetical protein COCMIDRAFT_22445 [Bipolaris oryzae ATCC 44560]